MVIFSSDQMSHSIARIRHVPLIMRLCMIYVVIFGALWSLGIFHSGYAGATNNNDYLNELAHAANSKVAKDAAQSPIYRTGTASRLLIPRIGINLPIEPGTHDPETNTWALSNAVVHYAVMSTPVNNIAGDTLMYGHYNRKLLRPTDNLAIDDELIVETAEGLAFHYVYTGDQVVDPSDTSILNTKSKTSSLTLLTCNGLLFEHRRLMHFSFTSVAPITQEATQ